MSGRSIVSLKINNEHVFRFIPDFMPRIGDDIVLNKHGYTGTFKVANIEHIINDNGSYVTINLKD